MHTSRYKEAKKVTLVGGVINIVLSFMKLIGGFIYHSHALIADGVHSLSDLLIDIMVLFASKYGSQDADASHPYGHQRIETAATLLLALLLVLAGAGISWDALDELIHAQHEIPQLLALPIAILSVFVNELLYHYTLRVGKKIQSVLLIANAWHHRSDGAASAVVSLGIFASLVGYPAFDTLAAIIVGLMIIKMGLEYGWNSVKELVDTAVDHETLLNIQRVILEIDGVQKIHQLRSRSMGHNILVDVHILVNPIISVSEGHYLAQKVHRELIKQLPRIKDVTVHVDPEDDESFCPSLDLPSRATLEQQFIEEWKKEFLCIQNLVIHYLDGRIKIDLICTTTDPETSARLKERTIDALKEYPCIKRISILYCPPP